FFRKTSMNFALAPASAVIIVCTARYTTVASRLLTLRPIVLLGNASYSIYLVHYVVFATVVALTARVTHVIMLDVAKLALVTVVIFLISIILFTYVEDPSRRWLRRQWGNRNLIVALAMAPACAAIMITAVRRLF